MRSGILNLEDFIQPEQLRQLPCSVEARDSDQFFDEIIVLHWVSSFLMGPDCGLLVVEKPPATPVRDICASISKELCEVAEARRWRLRPVA